MSKRWRRVCSLLSAAVLVFGMAGCAEKTGAGKNGVTQVTVWTNSGGTKSVMTEMVNKYNATTGKEKGIEIVYEVISGEWGQQVELALTSGSAPDIFPSPKFLQNIQNGQLAAINKMNGGEEFLSEFTSKVNLAGYTWKGDIYAVPNNSLTVALLYNKDMFKAAGLVDENGEAKPPETYEELREYAKKLTNPDKREYGIIFPVKSGAWFPYEIQYPMMSSVGHNGFDPVTNQYDYTPLKPIMETLLQIKEDGSCYPGAESVDADPARARFAEGGIGMKFGMSWDVGVLTDQFPAKCDWGVAPVPVVDKDHKYKQLMETYKGLVLNKKNVEEKDADKIFEVYKWLHGEEVQIECYKTEVALPWDFSIIQGVEVEGISEQWKAFAELLEISATPPMQLATDVTGETTLATMFVNEVWSGDGSLDDILEKWTKVSNDGIAKYQEHNPDYDPSTVDNSGLDLSR